MNEAVTVKKREERGDEFKTLSTGIRAKFRRVPQSIVMDAVALVKRPEVPMWYNEEKEREEPNPADPEYRRALEKFYADQYRVTFDCFALFGVELEGGIPEDDTWLKKVKLAEKLGAADLSRFDLDDPIDREFLYIRYVALGNQEYVELAALSRGEEGVAEAAESFQGSETRPTDQ